MSKNAFSLIKFYTGAGVWYSTMIVNKLVNKSFFFVNYTLHFIIMVPQDNKCFGNILHTQQSIIMQIFLTCSRNSTLPFSKYRWMMPDVDKKLLGIIRLFVFIF